MLLMDKWVIRKRPNRLERRFEFDSYDETRDFLDRLGSYSEATNRFPDISFGKNYVNITLRPLVDEQEAELQDEDYQLSKEIDDLIN